MAGELTFFSIGVDDAEKACQFYGALFGWSFSEPPSGRGAVIDSSNIAGGIHGGDPGASPYVFFSVDDIETAVSRVRELGGTVDDIADTDKSDDDASITRFGRFRLCRDDQGSPFGLHQPPGVVTGGDRDA